MGPGKLLEGSKLLAGDPPIPSPTGTELKFSKVKSINGIFPRPAGRDAIVVSAVIFATPNFPRKFDRRPCVFHPASKFFREHALYIYLNTYTHVFETQKIGQGWRTGEGEPHYFRPSAPKAHFRLPKLKCHSNMKTVR